MAVRWFVAVANYNSPEAEKFLADEWQPFAVTTSGPHHELELFLRKQMWSEEHEPQSSTKQGVAE